MQKIQQWVVELVSCAHDLPCKFNAARNAACAAENGFPVNAEPTEVVGIPFSFRFVEHVKPLLFLCSDVDEFNAEPSAFRLPRLFSKRSSGRLVLPRTCSRTSSTVNRSPCSSGR